jgi:membrane protease YdiL (CAAX protease family)
MIAVEIIATLSQVLLFALIPFVVHLVRYKTYKGFWKATGIYPAPGRTILIALLAGLLVAAGAVVLLLANTAMKAAAAGGGTVQGAIRALPNLPEKMIVLLIVSLFKTSFAEELFFRGFLGKILISRFGFNQGNMMQAFIFGIIHVLLFLTFAKVGIGFLALALLVPMASGYYAGYLNEKQGKGSIFPGWAMHGAGNLLSYSLFVFFIA